MIENFKLLTITHKLLNTEDLEHFVLRYDNNDDKAIKLKRLMKKFDQQEMLYLSTCNRVIYLFYGNRKIDENDCLELLQSINPTLKKNTTQNISKLIEFYQGNKAIRHIFEVCSSIDSLVIGEREIFRQFRQAYVECKKMGLCGDQMRIVEKCAVKAAKDIYTNTAIGAKPVSVVSLAIQEFLKRNLHSNARIILIGSGETNTTVGRFLKKHEYQNIVIFNRSYDNALKLSKELGAKAMHLRDLNEYNEGFDCIFASTSAQDAIITPQIFNLIATDDGSKLIIDLAIPPNVSKHVAQRSDVDYINIDSIRELATENLRQRSGNIAAARILLSSHLEEFQQLLKQRRIERAFQNLPKEIKTVKERAVHKVYKEAIERLDPDTQSLIMEIAEYMEKKCVAIPMKIARREMA